MKNLDGRLYSPVIEGMWKQHELWDGTYTFDDWVDALEIIEVKRANDAIIAENARRKEMY